MGLEEREGSGSRPRSHWQGKMLLFFLACVTCSVSTALISPAHNMEDVSEGDGSKLDKIDCELCVRRRTIHDKLFFIKEKPQGRYLSPHAHLFWYFFPIMSAQNFCFCQSFLQIHCFFSPFPDIRHIMGSVPAEQACKLWRQTYKGTAPSSCNIPSFLLAMRKEIFQTL